MDHKFLYTRCSLSMLERYWDPGSSHRVFRRKFVQVTGLADVMDIVHKRITQKISQPKLSKVGNSWATSAVSSNLFSALPWFPDVNPPQRFLNRDVEHEQLKSSVKEAEVPLSLEKSGNWRFLTHENES